jgi:hypothetical protein
MPKNGPRRSNEFQNRIGQLQEEFGMSDSEIDEIGKFISSLSKDSDMQHVLEEIIKYENFNIRQKVAFAHILGIFRADAGNRTITVEISEFQK